MSGSIPERTYVGDKVGNVDDNVDPSDSSVTVRVFSTQARNWPEGLRCAECKALITDGKTVMQPVYAEILTGMVGAMEVVSVVCRRCA